MGRAKKELTPEELEARKLRYWGPERNAQRRERYRQSKEYREKAIQLGRETYRKVREAQGLQVRLEDCREQLPRLGEIGVTRAVLSPDGPVPLLTFSVDELAVALSRNPQVLYRWMAAGMLPRPVVRAVNDRKRVNAVFLEAEVRALMEVFGEHQTKSAYYRSYHEETRDKIAEAVSRVRAFMRIDDEPADGPDQDQKPQPDHAGP